MNKLVSRNPVQRFKQGRKIIKAQSGTKVIATVDGRQVETTIEQARRNGWEYFNPSKQAEFIRNYPYIRYATEYRRPSPEFPAVIQDAQFGDYESGWTGKSSNNESGLVFDLEYGNLAWQPKKIRVPQIPIRVSYVPTQKSQSNSLTQNVSTQNIQPKAASPKKEYNSSRQVATTRSLPSRRKVQKISSPIFYGTKAGGSVNRNALSNITDDQKSKLIRTGKFREQDFANTKSLQIALNNYFANDAAGSIKEDNLWGKQTQKAFNLALNRADSPIVATTKGIEIQNPVSIISTYTPPSIKEGIANLRLNVPTYVNANRSQTRDWMRDNNINPYSVTGEMRKAVRRLRAGQANDNDKRLVRENDKLYDLLKDYYKQGGLISRNPIERFKQRNFR